MDKWQYTILKVDLVTRKYSIDGSHAELGQGEDDMSLLNKLGNEGWEVVSAQISQGYDSVSVYLLKRVLPGS